MWLFVTLIWSIFLFNECVYDSYLLHAGSLDVSGPFICDSDEHRRGDVLSVMWLTEQWGIIPAPLWLSNDFTRVLYRLVMAAVCHQWAHIFLVSVHLFVYCVENTLHSLGCKPLRIFVFSSSLLLLPSSFMLFSCTLARPYLFCSFHMPYLSFFFLLLVLCLHIYIGLCCHFLLLLEFLFIFIYFILSSPSPMLHFLFVSFLSPALYSNPSNPLTLILHIFLPLLPSSLSTPRFSIFHSHQFILLPHYRSTSPFV